MVITKGVGGWFFNSQALVADAFHALTDMVSDIMTLATVSFALKPPTDRFPNGYGKIESLGSLGVSSLLLIGGMAMGYGSLVHLIGDFAPALAHYLPHVHAHEHSHAIPSINAAWLALASIGAKEWLYRKTMKIALQKKSSVLASNAVHHRVDSLTAIVALVAIAGSNVFPSASWLDPVGGLLVAAMVVQAGAGNTRAALEELADAGIDDEVKEEVTKKVMEVGEEVIAVDGIKSGQNYLLTITTAVEEGTTLRDLEEIEGRIRSSVAGISGMWRVQVRFVRKGETAQNEFVKLNKKEE
ncbi:hypothetical protein K440DRAFT_552229 [Wilcoxina mikolae CBS 423.85]|nr:hypothetical protein K440DRAFT_552229 [Wilcoxina mikolae CBS 423.85]